MKWINIFEYLNNQSLDETIIAYPDITHKQMTLSVLHLSHFLRENYIQTASLYFQDNILFSYAFLACAHAGVHVLIPSNMANENIEWMSTQSDIILTNENINLHKAYQLNSLPKIDLHNNTENSTPADLQLKDITLSLQTSGSNGCAKIIKKNLSSMQNEVNALQKISGDLVNTKYLHAISSVSPQHLYGFSFSIMLSLCARWIIHPQQYRYPEMIFESTLTHEHILWISSPAILHRLAHNTSWQEAHNKIQCIFSAGGILNSTTVDLIRNHYHTKLINIYGSTETGVIAYNQETELWSWFNHVQHGIDKTTNHLWIESPWSQGKQIIADTIEEFHNGFKLLGRTDRIIKLEDKRISLNSIEQQFMQHDWIEDIYIAKHPQHTHLLAWIALSDSGIDVLRQEGRLHLISTFKKIFTPSLEKISLPRYWRFTDKLPRDTQSKITQNDLIQVTNKIQNSPVWTHIDTRENTYLYQCKIPLDLSYFKGHFASFPLVPGVVQLRWVLQLSLQQNIITEQSFTRVENLKFQHFMRPNDPVCLELKFNVADKKLYFKYYFDEIIYGSGRILLK